MRRWAALALCFAAAAAGACRGDRGAWRAQVVAVPEPPVASREAADRAKLAEVRQRVQQQVDARGATAASAAAAFGELGRVYLAYDFPSGAEASLSNAAALEPGNREWHYLLGVIAQQGNRLDVASARLTRALALAPGDGATLVRLAQVEFEKGDRAAARAHDQQALGIAGAGPAAHFGLGRIAAAQNDLDGAIAHFQQALDAQPRASAVHSPLALALRGKGRRDEAQQHLALAGPTAVTFPDPLVEDLAGLVTGARAHLFRGDRARDEHDLDTAQREYQQAVDADPGLALAHHSLGTVLGERGNMDEAVVHLRRATELDPRFPEAFFNLATALLRQQRTDEAMRALDRVLELDPAHEAARLRRAAVWRERGDTKQARADLEAVLARQPLQPDAIVDLAVLLAKSGQGRQADQLIREKLARNPPAAVQAKLYFTRAFLDNGSGHLPAAIEDYRQAVAADRDYTDAWFNLAVSLVMARRNAEAASAFAEVVRLQPSNPRAYLGQARALTAAGDWRQARSVLEGARQRLGDAAVAHDLAELLAASPDAAVRDGQRALDLSMSAYAATHGAEHAEVVAMALAELGRFADAVDWQRKLAAQAEAAGAAPEMRARLRANLGQYQRGQRVRMDGNLRVP